MINLLPSQQKEELLNQERLRLVFILGMLFSLFLLSLALILLLVENYFSLNLGDQKILFEEKEKKVSFNKDLEEEIVKANSSFSNLDSFYEKQHNLTESLEKIYQTLPGGAYLTDFNLVFTDQKIGTQLIKRAKISLSGFCPTRELLLVLKENLENEESFSDIYFSPGSWVEPVETTFSVAFYLNQY